jgi:hypothetical protein
MGGDGESVLLVEARTPTTNNHYYQVIAILNTHDFKEERWERTQITTCEYEQGVV